MQAVINLITSHHWDSLQFPVFHGDRHVESEHGADAEDGDAEADRAEQDEPAAVGLLREDGAAKLGHDVVAHGRHPVEAAEDRVVGGQGWDRKKIISSNLPLIQGVPRLLSQLSEALISVYVDGIKYNFNHLIPTLGDFV